MCTQEIIWCSCGHGELLPIVKCPTAESTGKCWTVVHGDHRIVLQMKCSYCLSGHLEETPLGAKARPEGELAAKIENKDAEKSLGDLFGDDRVVANDAGKMPADLDDVVDTDWSEFTLDPELWQYV